MGDGKAALLREGHCARAVNSYNRWAMLSREHIRQSFSAALPIMLGYVAIGIPCGILSASIGLDALDRIFLFSALFYSGAGQFMIPNMFLAGSSIASIVASVSLVNTRQMLYAASLAPALRRGAQAAGVPVLGHRHRREPTA